MKSAVAEFVVEGITTNIDFLLKILENENFKTNTGKRIAYNRFILD